ncbi:SMC family ATPase [Spirillospora sp. NPDC047279]|uniref:SMC family ATPase n=1 Tax=Spirillospora sp. NPDC047279 TaxID=3155478 RepID=UPI003408464A
MRPISLHLENFCSFRTPTTIDLHDVDYFVLVGPTGAGKSTIIDAICFALYGTVPRWGRENTVSWALAPSATSGKVGLVFEAAGRRYGIVRTLVRNAAGRVGTSEMRLDELDTGVDPAQGTHALLGASVRNIAEGRRVTSETERLTGLEYRHFTQCVILPQGRFAEFLHSAPRDRQELLVQLLDADVFERIRRRAVDVEKAAASTVQAAQGQLDALADADEAAEVEAVRRLDELNSLSTQVNAALGDLRVHDEQVAELESERGGIDHALHLLDAVEMPGHVSTLAEELRAAHAETARLDGEVGDSERKEDQARETLAGLGDKTDLKLAVEAHAESRRLRDEVEDLQSDLEVARSTTQEAELQIGRARDRLTRAEVRRDHARDAHVGADLARRLTVGEPCPVCRHPVAELPRHPAPADLDDTQQEVTARAAELELRQTAHQEGLVRVAGLNRSLDDRQDQLSVQLDQVRAHPDVEVLNQRLGAIAAAEEEAGRARQAAVSARTLRAEAERRWAELKNEADRAHRELDAARDSLVALGAPQVERSDVHVAWSSLVTWCGETADGRRRAAADLDARLEGLRWRRDDERDALGRLLDAHGVLRPTPMESDAIGRAVTADATRAETWLERVRDNRRRAERLGDQIRRHREEQQVAHELGQRLRANNFENWLCGEALELLVIAASQTLRELSDGQFELVLDAKNAIEVIDYAEAGMRRSVRTLSGGETFQASLALALALTDRVAGLAAADTRSLDSIFLDEGFGTLDPAMLDTVATTLERLASSGDRMVGIVTHVPALAERVPVRFEVTRDGNGSHLEKKTT